MDKGKILVIDDEKAVQYFLDKTLQKKGYEVLLAGTGEEGVKLYEAERPELVLLDLKLPDLDGLAVLKRLKTIDGDVLSIIITAHGEIPSAVTAMRMGAYDYITKPFEMEVLGLSIEKALEKQSLRREVEELRKKERERLRVNYVVGPSGTMAEIYSLVDKVAASDESSVLIWGQSGTGKELVARAVHMRSRRGAKPFVSLSCAALPEHLIESELFGYEPGAFTDAKKRKEGLFELANEGTLFLDEIGDMQLATQAKLLRTLETKTFMRLGGTKEITVNVRILTATNKDLASEVQKSTFREDLFYRLNVVSIQLPPLRERREDIIPLAKAFLEEFDRTMNKKVASISPEAEAALLAYSWPGNVRELRNVIERALILGSGDVLEVDHLVGSVRFPVPLAVAPQAPPIPTLEAVAGGPEGFSLEKMKEEWEREVIRRTLEMTKGNQVKAANYLQLSRDVLRYRMKQYGLLQEKNP
jgi:DNA-binding NtrC family response regulator